MNAAKFASLVMINLILILKLNWIKISYLIIIHQMLLVNDLLKSRFKD